MRKIILVLLTILVSSVVYAVPHYTIITDFYEQLEQALTFSTDLLNSKDLNTMFYVCVVFALAGGLAIKKWRALANHNEPFTVGDTIGKSIVTMLIFNLMLHPYKDDLLIRDKITGQTQNFQNVPTGIALPIIMYDSLTSSFDYAVDKYGTPIVPLKYGGNGVTFSLLFELNKFPDKFKAQFPNLDNNINNYMEVCYKIGLDMGYISNTTITGDFLASIRYPNYYFSADYLDATGNGTRLSCIDFFTQLQRDLTDPKVKQTFCNKLLGTVTTGSQCDNMLDHNVKQLISPNYANPSNIIVDTLIADHVTQAYAEKANRQMYTQGLMQSLMADNWLPQLQAMMLTLAIMLLPLMLIFLPYAPIKLFIWYAGLFAWLILWHGIDAIMGVQYQHELVNALKAYGDDISVDKLVSAPTEAMQVAVQYGKQRWQSMSMALTLAGVIGFSVNSAISSVAGASAQSAQSNADSSGSALGGSAGLSGAKQQMFNETTSAKAFNNVVSQSNGNQGYYDNASMQQTVSTLDAIGSAKGKLDAVKDMANVSSTSEYVAQTSTEQSIGATTASRAEAQALGVSVERMKELDSGSVLNANEAKSLNEKFGTNSFKDGMSVKDFAFTQNGEVSNLTLSGAGAKGTESYTIDSKGDVVKSDIDGSMSEHHDKTKTANVVNQANVINEAKKVDDTSTKSDSSITVTQGSQLDTKAGTTQQIIHGEANKETLSAVDTALHTKGGMEQLTNQELEQFNKEYGKERMQDVSTSAKAGVKSSVGLLGNDVHAEADVSVSGAERVNQNQTRQELASIAKDLKDGNIDESEYIKRVGELRDEYAGRNTGMIAGAINDNAPKVGEKEKQVVDKMGEYKENVANEAKDMYHKVQEKTADSKATDEKLTKYIKDNQ